MSIVTDKDRAVLSRMSDKDLTKYRIVMIDEYRNSGMIAFLELCSAATQEADRRDIERRYGVRPRSYWEPTDTITYLEVRDD